jgi:M6 family metalloprotease-like protein
MSVVFGEILTLGQRSGPDVRLRVFGDEHYARYEDLAGYSVVYDPGLGRFCYAALQGNRFRSTGVPVDQPPPNGLVRHLQESPAAQEAHTEERRMARAAVARSPVRDAAVVRTIGPNQGLLEGRRLSIGAVRGLTILVEFQDVGSTVTAADVREMLNGAGYTRNGNICSAREYFQRVSNGRLDYTNDVVGPYRLGHERAFYVDHLLVEEALQLAVADGVDLSRFDSRSEGILDALNVLYAGQTQYLGELWPHNYFINLQFGPIHTNLYLLTSLGRTPADLSIGTFCHENGHLLCRFPDMYDYAQRDGDNVRSAGIGDYCLMGAGNHLDFGRSPSPVCAYLRDLAGWCDNEVALNAGGAFEAAHGDYGTVLKYRTSKPNEYILVENRSKVGLDRALPASGLALYHCDILGSNELQQGTADRHYQCALLQADGHRDLENNVNQGDGGDLYGLVAGTALSAESNPHTREWDGRDSGLVVSDIGQPGERIAFRVGQATSPQAAEGEAQPMVEIPDANAVGVSSAIAIAASGIVERIRVSVDIQHTYIGDLRVELVSPGARRALLHGQVGGSANDLIATFDSASPGTLAAMVGAAMQGSWVLRVTDLVAEDVGTLRKWRLELSSGPA